jgi:four helix bundle protein
MAHARITAASGEDPLRRMRVFELSEDISPDSWTDAEKLVENTITEKVASQLYAAIGSIGANLAEGYSRSSGKDRVRFFEYSLGSVRECMKWYRHSRPVLDEATVTDRLDRLEEMRRLLLAIIPRERGRTIRKSE